MKEQTPTVHSKLWRQTSEQAPVFGVLKMKSARATVCLVMVLAVSLAAKVPEMCKDVERDLEIEMAMPAATLRAVSAKTVRHLNRELASCVHLDETLGELRRVDSRVLAYLVILMFGLVILVSTACMCVVQEKLDLLNQKLNNEKSRVDRELAIMRCDLEKQIADAHTFVGLTHSDTEKRLAGIECQVAAQLADFTGEKPASTDLSKRMGQFECKIENLYNTLGSRLDVLNGKIVKVRNELLEVIVTAT